MKKNLMLLPVWLMLLSACVSEQKAPEVKSNPPSLIMMNRMVLQRSKNAIQRKDPTVMPAFEALIAAADKMLDEGTFSVMNKKQTPPSGDKHDYMSMGPYWWPDPSKPDGLPYIRKDGEINPEFYDCTDRDQLQRMAKNVRTLGIAYFFTEDEKYAIHAAKLLKTWFLDEATKMNPNLNFGQSVPGVCDGRCYGIVDTPCLASMIDGVILLQASPAWSDADNEALKAWFSEYNNWLLTGELGMKEDKTLNNHATQYDLQTCVYDIFTGKSGEAEKRLHTITRARVDSQIEADGSQPQEMARTKPWGYSTGNLLHFVDLALLGERVGVNLWEHVTPKGASIKKAIEWFFPYISGEQAFPKDELSNHRSASSLASVLMKTADRFGVKEYQKQLKNLVAFTGNEYNVETSLNTLTNPILDGPVTSDADLFDALNLDYEGMAAVKAAVGKKDYATAKKELVAYLKTREKPLWFFNWRDLQKSIAQKGSLDGNPAPKIDTAYVEQITANILPSSGLAYDFGDSEVIDWSINPTEIEYVEWTWQLSRHGFWQTLGQAYWATGDERYAKAFVHQMTSWVKFNTLHDFADQVKYSRWRTIETGIRTLGSWPASFFYFLGSPSFDDEAVILMVKSFYEHAIHLRAYPTRNNWLTMEMDGLFYTGILFPEFKDAADWRDFASMKMYEEEKNQFYEDGAQIELSPGYHGVSLGCMVGIYRIAKLNGYTLPGDYAERLEKMYEYYQNILLPDGRIPSLNDGHWNQRRSTLTQGYEYMPHRTDFQYVGSEGKEGTAPSYTSVWMPWTGWYVMRSGWDADALYSIFEVGPYGAGHQHEDKLTFSIHAYGNTLISEGGKYDYDTSQWRDYVLSARAHNVTRVDGQDQRRRARASEDLILHSRKPLENRWISNEQVDFGEGWYNEGFGAKLDTTVTQYRALTFVKNKYWLLFDVFTPSDAATHTYNSWFHFDTTDYTITSAPYAVLSTEKGASNIAIIPMRSEGANLKVIIGQEDPEVQGWISDLLENGQGEKYEVHKAATTEVIRNAAGQVVEPYLLYPLREGETLPVKEVKALDNQTLEIVYNDGHSEKVTYSIKGNSLETLTITTEKGEIKVL